jgi:phytoene synthase
MMLEIAELVEQNSSSVTRGYKSCHGAVKKFFKGHLWPSINLPGARRNALDTVLFNLMRTIDLLDLESANGLSLDVWSEIRDDLSDAFQGQCSSVELAALVDASRRFEIPKQFLFDPLRGADIWIRRQKFDTFDELESFCSHVGGSSLASAMPILGVIKPNYEVDAIECGKAIMLTQLLLNCVSDIKRNKVFLAQEDLDDCEIDTPRLKLRRPSQSFRHLVRIYVSRIQSIFHRARHVGQYLDFDGRRSLKSLLAVNWQTLLKIQVEPELLLSSEGVLTNREQLLLKSRHLMGLEKDLPIFVDQQVDH